MSHTKSILWGVNHTFFFYLWCNWSICTASLLSRVNYLRHPDLWECLDQERCWVRMTSNLGSEARTMSRGSCLPWPQWWTPRAGCSPAGLWNGAFFAAVWRIWRFCFHEKTVYVWIFFNFSFLHKLWLSTTICFNSMHWIHKWSFDIELIRQVCLLIWLRGQAACRAVSTFSRVPRKSCHLRAMWKWQRKRWGLDFMS